jgi:hypothetical protein
MTILETILDASNYICSTITTGLTVLMLVSYRKPKRFKSMDQLFGIFLTIITLPIFILVSGARLNVILGVVLFILGGILGVVRGLTIKMYFVDDEVISRNSMLSLAGWGGSVALSSVMNSFDSSWLASLGLAPLVISSGIQIFINITMIARRMMMRPVSQ